MLVAQSIFIIIKYFTFQIQYNILRLFGIISKDKHRTKYTSLQLAELASGSAIIIPISELSHYLGFFRFSSSRANYLLVL